MVQTLPREPTEFELLSREFFGLVYERLMIALEMRGYDFALVEAMTVYEQAASCLASDRVTAEAMLRVTCDLLAELPPCACDGSLSLVFPGRLRAVARQP